MVAGHAMNTLFILVDQWPAHALGFLGSGVSTPHVNELAAGSTVFTNAFTACPLCSPARGALLTARWPCRTGMLDNVGTGYSLQPPLSPDERTWLDPAVAAGYYVGYFGKWHLGANGPQQRGVHRHPPQVEPNSKPFDPATDVCSYGIHRQQMEEHHRFLREGRPPFWGVLKTTREETTPFRTARRAQKFLAEVGNTSEREPFLLTVSFAPPHFPHYLPPEYARRADSETVELPASFGDDFRGKPWYQSVPWWPSMDTADLDENEWKRIISFGNLHITLVDDAIGEILRTLRENGLEDRTVVVFASDHGDMAGAHRRFGKGPYFYDEVWRIPLLVRFPGVRPATQPAFVSILDLGATLFRMVGADDDPARPWHGRDLHDLFGSGQKPERWPQEVFGVYDLYNGMVFPIRAVRTEEFKYVWNAKAVDEFYDLRKDPQELHNLAGDPETAPQRLRLRHRLFQWMDEIGDDLPARTAELPPAGTILATGAMGP